MKRKHYNWELPAKIEDRLGESTYGKQRAIFEDDNLLIILHDIPDADQLTRDSQVFWRKPDGEFLCNGQGDGQKLLKQLLNSYDKKLDKLDEAYEKVANSDDLFAILEEVAPVNRTSTNLYNTLQSARELIKEDEFLLEMRDRSYEMQRNFELLLSDAKMALDYKIAKNAEEELIKSSEAVEAQHRLNILAAIFFPVMAIATIFGMNLSHGLEGSPPLIFWIVFILGLFTGIFFKSWVVKKK